MTKPAALSAEQICTVFNACFADDQNPDARARMVRGGDEPLYMPATRARPIAEIVYARGLAQSCLHEAAHWLRAGAARRRLVDYGYWYAPDGRDAAAQAQFETLEAEVQGLECILADAAGVEFRISCDNLIRPDPSPEFCAAITAAAQRQLAHGLSGRAAYFTAALREHRTQQESSQYNRRAIVEDEGRQWSHERTSCLRSVTL
jgi:elongation factor P hydroxylase